MKNDRKLILSFFYIVFLKYFTSMNSAFRIRNYLYKNCNNNTKNNGYIIIKN